MATINYIPPVDGEPIRMENGKPIVPERPFILFIRGDGVGPDIWAAAQRVFDAAVDRAFGGRRRIAWMEIFAGQAAFDRCGSGLPEETLDAIRQYKVAIKGPLTTPVGGGIRSLNVTLRQKLDLYACIRPIRYYQGVPSPVKEPHKLDVVIFRENTEDVYAGIEWPSGSPEALKVIRFLQSEMHTDISLDAGIGVKPATKAATRRLVRRAIQFAIEKKKPSVTVVHKGNIMKYTEGAFKNWAYELALDEFRDIIVTEQELLENPSQGDSPANKIILNDRIADSMFQQVILRPDEYHVLATPNLNGDYLSDACAALVGGLGMAPGANIGDEAAVFEATHGSAPKYTGQDKVNPSSVILSGCMMMEFMGWDIVSEIIQNALEKTIIQKFVTYDLARNMGDAHLVACSEFGSHIIKNMQ